MRRRDQAMKKRGVHFHKSANKWTARIKADGKTKHLGLFDTFEEAAQVRLEEEKKYSYKDLGVLKEHLTQDELKEVLHYDPETGIFIWLVNYGGHIVKGREAGNVDTDCRIGGKTYRRIKVYKKSYAAHRLAFLYMTGVFPDVVDHINGNGIDNRWENLRNTTLSGNNRNARKRHDNRSGHAGVSWHKRTKKWAAYITYESKTRHLGIFDKLENAISARKVAETTLGFHENHGDDRPL